MNEDENDKKELTPQELIERANRPALLPRAKDVIALARAVREVPELWEIFLRTGPDKWISDEDAHKLRKFAAEFRKANPQFRNAMGCEKPLLRALARGTIQNLDDEDRVAEILFLKTSD